MDFSKRQYKAHCKCTKRAHTKCDDYNSKWSKTLFSLYIYSMINIVKIEINDDSVLIFLQFMGLVYFVYRTLAVTIAEANTHLVVINGNFFFSFRSIFEANIRKVGRCLCHYATHKCTFIWRNTIFRSVNIARCISNGNKASILTRFDRFGRVLDSTSCCASLSCFIHNFFSGLDSYTKSWGQSVRLELLFLCEEISVWDG